jgi:hypothetical protein
MSGDDLLTRATKALGEASEVSPADVAATRARIMASVRKGERSRGRLLVLVLPVAAMLATGTALGRNGSALRGLWDQISERLLGSSSGGSSPDQGHGLERARAIPPAPAPRAPVAPEPPELVAPAPPRVVAPPGRAPVPRAPMGAPSHAGARLADVDPLARDADVDAGPSRGGEAIALERYRVAHRRHFVEQNYGAALAAWDDYLQSAPNGTLAIDARYNRAIALLRLNRRAEAAAALSPFARGEVGAGYRREQAGALLSAIADTDAGHL